jgi:Ca2+-binding EF-hand superfamily protein
MKVNSIRMFKQIQKRIKDTMSAAAGFCALDTNNVGFLTLRDFQINFSKHFDLSLKAAEVRQIYAEIDTDENGIIKFAEFSEFYDTDYN